MRFFDRCYVYFYALFLKTSSRENAHDSAAIAIGFAVNLHIAGVFSVLSVIMHRDLILMPGRLGDLAIGILVVAVFAYPYLIRGRGDRLLREFAGEIQQKRAFWIGLAISLWSLFFPVLCVWFLAEYFPPHGPARMHFR